MVEATGLLLLDHVFKYADIFGLQNFNGEGLTGVVIVNKAIQRKQLRGIVSYEC